MPLLDRQRATATVVGAPPAAYFATSAVFHYLGPAFAVLLFARLEPLGVAGLRIATAAVVLCAWRRPWRGARPGRPPRAGSWSAGVSCSRP